MIAVVGGFWGGGVAVLKLSVVESEICVLVVFQCRASTAKPFSSRTYFLGRQIVLDKNTFLSASACRLSSLGGCHRDWPINAPILTVHDFCSLRNGRSTPHIRLKPLPHPQYTSTTSLHPTLKMPASSQPHPHTSPADQTPQTTTSTSSPSSEDTKLSPPSLQVKHHA